MVSTVDAKKLADQWGFMWDGFRSTSVVGATWDFQVYGVCSYDPLTSFVVGEASQMVERLQKALSSTRRSLQIALNFVTPHIVGPDFFPSCPDVECNVECSCTCCQDNHVATWLLSRLPPSCHVVSILSDAICGTPVCSLDAYVVSGCAGISCMFLPNFDGLEMVPLTMDDMFHRGTTCFRRFKAVVAFVPEEAIESLCACLRDIDMGGADFVLGVVHSLTRVGDKWFAGLGIRGHRAATYTEVVCSDSTSTADCERSFRHRLECSGAVELAFASVTDVNACYLKCFTDVFHGVPIVGVCTKYCVATSGIGLDRQLVMHPRCDAFLMVRVDGRQ